MTRPRAPRRSGPSRGPEPVTSITGAAEPLSDDIARRTQRYVLQMGLRVVCFGGAVVVEHWSRWLLLLGAVVLPYVAVLMANAGRERPSAGEFAAARGELPGRPSPAGLGPAPDGTL